MGETGADDEAGGIIVKGLGGIRVLRLVDGMIGQLAVSLGKIFTPVKDDHGAAVIGGEG